MNPYKIKGPAMISFSGGRTSGFMLSKILKAHRGNLPEDVHAVFANTGKEAPETLDFVKDCSEKFNVKIHWVEHYYGPERPIHRTKEVTYETASRNGEPFERLIDHRGLLPNPANRMCTSELKIKVMQRFMRKIMGYKTWSTAIGLRYDEPRRVASSKRANDYESWTNITPIYDAKHTVKDVTKFWEKQNFDLKLVNQDGKTPAGNCDLCFLKGMKTINSILKERPEMADWWIKQEKKFPGQTGGKFRINRPDYIQLLDISKQDDQKINDIEDDQMTCFCHD